MDLRDTVSIESTIIYLLVYVLAADIIKVFVRSKNLKFLTNQEAISETSYWHVGKSKINSAKKLPPVRIKPGTIGLLLWRILSYILTPSSLS